MQVYIPAAAVGSSDVPVDPRPRSRTALRLIENAIGLLVEIPAALLVVAEVGVLLAGVVSRYVFHEPLVWSNELAGILFLWPAILGAVVAFRRSEHRRMTAIVAMAGPRTRVFLRRSLWSPG
ncbi:TRAP transporter small permease [Methylobacterium oryzae]|uniref:TRAP transporter small permease n=1 Tax=Methylobacterium oryzae TaxID=334852 RepID=UPI003AF50A9A